MKGLCFKLYQDCVLRFIKNRNCVALNLVKSLQSRVEHRFVSLYNFRETN